MRLLLALLLLWIVPAAHAEPAQSVLAPDAESRWVAFELTAANQIGFAMTLNGVPARALLDTGLTDSVASARFAQRAGLRATVAGEALAIGGPMPIRWAAAGDLTIGGMRRSGGRIAVARLDGLGIGEVDVLIGSDVLACCALEIDHDARRFRLIRSGRLPFRGTATPLRMADNGHSWTTEMTIGARRLRPMLVDTGDGSAVTFVRSAWNSAGIVPAASSSTIAYGLGGAIETEVAIVPEVRIAALTAREVEVRIEEDGGFSTRIGAAGRIGTGFLRRYRVLIDPGAGRMVFAPGAEADVPPLRSTSGLLLAFADDRLRVLHVMRGSPAEAGGWRAGELICTVDGRPVRETTSSAGLVGWTIAPPGRTLRLGLCEGGERLLTLRNFY